MTPRNESFKWQTICDAFILPQRRGVFRPHPRQARQDFLPAISRSISDFIARMPPGPPISGLRLQTAFRFVACLGASRRFAHPASSQRRVFSNCRWSSAHTLPVSSSAGSCLRAPHLLEFARHGLHLGVEIVEKVQHQRLGNHGQLGRAELQLAVMRQDHVQHQRLEPRRKTRPGYPSSAPPVPSRSGCAPAARPRPCIRSRPPRTARGPCRCRAG